MTAFGSIMLVGLVGSLYGATKMARVSIVVFNLLKEQSVLTFAYSHSQLVVSSLYILTELFTFMLTCSLGCQELNGAAARLYFIHIDNHATRSP
jgi:hypothetical protein